MNMFIGVLQFSDKLLNNLLTFMLILKKSYTYIKIKIAYLATW